MRFIAESWTSRFVFLALAGSGLSLAGTAPIVHNLPSALDSGTVSGWVLADLNGDQSADLATAQSGLHDANGYAQEVRISLGAFQQTSFHFQSRGATVELSTRDVDGDDDGDLIVFEPLSNQPIAVWLNDGAGTFHEGHLADYRKLWSERPGPAWRSGIHRLGVLAIFENRSQPVTPPASMATPDPAVPAASWHNEPARREARRSDFRPRAPPCNS